MKTVGFGQPRRVPGVAVKELEGAIALVAAFGAGDQRLPTLLQDLKAAAEHNQKLVNDATLALRRLADLEDQKRKLDERENAVNEKIRKIEAAKASLADWDEESRRFDEEFAKLAQNG
jgi:Sec-independent protein translocase protein TatA